MNLFDVSSNVDVAIRIPTLKCTICHEVLHNVKIEGMTTSRSQAIEGIKRRLMINTKNPLICNHSGGEMWIANHPVIAETRIVSKTMALALTSPRPSLTNKSINIFVVKPKLSWKAKLCGFRYGADGIYAGKTKILDNLILAK